MSPVYCLQEDAWASNKNYKWLITLQSFDNCKNMEQKYNFKNYI